MNDISRVIEELREADEAAIRATTSTGFSDLQTLKLQTEFAYLCHKHLPAILDAYEAAVADGAAARDTLSNTVEHLPPGPALAVAQFLASPSPGQQLLAERDRLREQLAAAMKVVKSVDACEAFTTVITYAQAVRRDHPELFETGGGE